MMLSSTSSFTLTHLRQAGRQAGRKAGRQACLIHSSLVYKETWQVHNKMSLKD